VPAPSIRDVDSSADRETWRFDGSRFVLVASTPIPPPG
jgi:hypothetical protein